MIAPDETGRHSQSVHDTDVPVLERPDLDLHQKDTSAHLLE